MAKRKRTATQPAPDLNVVTVRDLIERLEMYDACLPVELFNSRGESEPPIVTLVMDGRTMKSKSVQLSAESDE